jgi:hypothetical protein
MKRVYIYIHIEGKYVVLNSLGFGKIRSSVFILQASESLKAKLFVNSSLYSILHNFTSLAEDG